VLIKEGGIVKMQKGLLVGMVFLFLAGAWGQGLLSADPATEKIISKLEAKAATVKTYRADMTMTTERMGKKMVWQGKILFKKPRKMWMEMIMDMGAMKMKQIHVSDGKITWIYQPQMKMVTKIDMERVTAEMKEEAGGSNSGDISKPFQLFQRETLSCRIKKSGGKKFYVFQGLPKIPEAQKTAFTPAKIEMWLAADDGLVRKIIMFSEEGKEMMSQEYTNVKINVRLADSQFKFTPPEGVQVMDMTEGSVNMMREMQK